MRCWSPQTRRGGRAYNRVSSYNVTIALILSPTLSPVYTLVIHSFIIVVAGNLTGLDTPQSLQKEKVRRHSL